MKKIYLALSALMMVLATAFGSAPAAFAGSNNGTSNWYWWRTCSAGGQNLVLSNYDTAGTWQTYHAGMTTSGSILGYQPTALYIGSVKSTTYLSDGFHIIADQKKYTVKAVWSKPFSSVSCSIYG